MQEKLKLTHLSSKPSFSLTDEEWAKFDAWAATKSHSMDPMGTQFTFQFTPTSLGTITSVRCGVTKDELVLTDFSSW